MKSPELLLPVGNMSMALAAIHGGADAIYVGVPGFNARGRSYDFSMEELKELIDLCHLYGVKVHLAFNILIFQDELTLAQKVLEEIIPMGPDAFIVQDLGLARLIRQMCPEMRIHGSTQMTVTTDDAIHLLEDLNIQRFVLGRENSLSEMRLIRENTKRELEVFVHGALCVAYSGQCFTSESLGGRSANRGQCAQSCRLSYEMFVDSEKRDLADKKFLVSPQDLCGVNEVGELIAAGIDSFKVEGRLKGPEYVMTAATTYREAIMGRVVSESDVQKMALSYSRGFFSGWLHGVNHQKLVEGSYSAHRGIEVGRIEKILEKSILIHSNKEIKAGMGILTLCRGEEIGSKVFKARKVKEQSYEVSFLSKINLKHLKLGERVWINSDDTIENEVKKRVSDRSEMKRIEIHAKLILKAGSETILEVRDPEGRSVIVQGAIGESAKSTVKTELYWEELKSLGGTPFKIKGYKTEGADVYIGQRDLKILRRSMVELLTKKRLETHYSVQAVSSELKHKNIQAERSVLNVLLRQFEQVQDFVSFMKFEDKTFLGHVILDFEFGKNYSDSVSLLKSNGFKVAIATTRILKPKEHYNLKIILNAKPDAILVRNLGALHCLQDKGIALMGDFSLNAANSMCVEYLLSKKLDSITLSYDLNLSQVQSLMSEVDTSRVEITLHQYMPEFHMEHCVFAAFMSKGSSFKDCGKPCEKHTVELKDSYGNMHFLKADQECRNTMFRATAQSSAFLFEELKMKPAFWRFESMYERGEELHKKISGYLKLLSQEMSLSDVVASVGSLEKYGVTEGQLMAQEAWVDRKKSNHILS
jgi:U32 family peptidase